MIIGEESVLVQLVSELIRLNRAADPDVATVAAQCLSEIGPVNLNVVALRGRCGSTLMKTHNKFGVI